MGIPGAWQDFGAEVEESLSSLYYAVNTELTARAIEDIRDLMTRLVDALEHDDRKALARASRKYRSLPRHTRDWWQAWNHSYVDHCKNDVPGADYDFEPIEFVEGAADLRAALRRKKRRGGR